MDKTFPKYTKNIKEIQKIKISQVGKMQIKSD